MPTKIAQADDDLPAGLLNWSPESGRAPGPEVFEPHPKDPKVKFIAKAKRLALGPDTHSVELSQYVTEMADLTPAQWLSVSEEFFGEDGEPSTVPAALLPVSGPLTIDLGYPLAAVARVTIQPLAGEAQMSLGYVLSPVRTRWSTSSTSSTVCGDMTSEI